MSAIEQKVKELAELQHLIVFFVDNVTSNNGEDGSDEEIVKAAKGIERDIKDVLRYVQASYFVQC